jgi:O-antigen/teichoic acid export membrane protein
MSEVRSVSLIGRAMKASLITSCASMLHMLMTFVFKLILVRILFPQDFGLFAFILSIIEIIRQFSILQLDQAIVRSRGDVNRCIDAAFTFQLCITLTVIIAFNIAVPFLEKVFAKPGLASFLRAMSLVLLIDIARIPMAYFRKELDFYKIRLPELIGELTGGLSSIVLAFLGFGVWSLVFGTLIQRFLQLFISLRLLSRLPRLRFDFKTLVPLLRFSSLLYIIAIMSVLYARFDAVLVGIISGKQQLGFYSIACYFSEKIYLLGDMLGSVLFPSFSKVQSDPEVLKKGFAMITKYYAIASCSVGAVVIPLASPFITYLLGSRWLPAKWPLIMFTILAIMMIPFAPSHEGYKAIGRQVISFFICVHAALWIVCAGPFLTKRFGIIGMSIAASIPAYLGLFPAIFLIKRYIGVNVLKVLWRPALSLLVCVLAGVAAHGFIISIWCFFLASFLLFVLYVALNLIMDRGIISETRYLWGHFRGAL